MSPEQKDQGNGHVLAKYMNAIEDRNARRAHMEKIMFPLVQIVEAYGRGTLLLQTSQDPAFIDTSTQPYALRIPPHEEVVGAFGSLKGAEQLVQKKMSDVKRAGISLDDLAKG